MSALDFNYRKVVGKKRRVMDDIDKEIDDILNEPPKKRVKLEPSSSEWFHNYEALSKGLITDPKELSKPKHALQTLVNVNLGASSTSKSLKLQPKSLELIERSNIKKSINLPSLIVADDTKSISTKAKERAKRTKQAFKVLNDNTNTITTKKGGRKTKKPAVKIEYITEEQKLFPYEGLEIFDRIYVGGTNVAKDKELLEKRNIIGIVNATKELPNYFEDDYSYFKIPVTDSLDSPLSKYFDDATKFMNEQLENPEKSVLVHCQMGQSRSPSVILACMLFLILFHYN